MITPKIAKGARDLKPDQMAIRERVFDTILKTFESRGAVTIDTPVFELKETLTGKYGEDSKLIYDLKDQGGELLSLRYDLTVPFARYVALNGISNIKRYQIGKVYRRDQPQMSRGRFREFYQCDFDVAGSSLLVADAEVIKVTTDVLRKLQLGDFKLKINDRRLLDGILDICGVPEEKFSTTCSAIDKLDKMSWESVRAEMVEQKGLDTAAADEIGRFVGVKSATPIQLLESLRTDERVTTNERCLRGLEKLEELVALLNVMGALRFCSLDLSLARGLDYYTGVIFEAVLEGSNVGSIAAGGRYDDLVGMFGKKQVPAVGLSLGIERIFTILEQKSREEAKKTKGKIRETKTRVLVMSADAGLQIERIRMTTRLWEKDIAAEFTYKADPTMQKQLSYATSQGIPFGIVMRFKDIDEGVVEWIDIVSGNKYKVPDGEIVAAIATAIAESGPLGLVIPGK